MFWRKDFNIGIEKSRFFPLMIMLFGIFCISQIGYSDGNNQSKKVKIEYFGRKDCKNCANLEKFLMKARKKKCFLMKLHRS